MIPVELELQNFLAYRQPGPLRFEGIHIGCLAGPNGAGKSSLLDAMTWALWGRARSNSPDALIHQGQREMRVSLIFDQEGARYRVIRQRKAGKRGASLLELQVLDPPSGSWRSLSEATMRATQARIDSLLRLDYDTFVNSAFLMQGAADLFTTKSPAQRKQVLATILGLERWETLEDRAKERIAETRAEIQRMDGWLAEVAQELAKGGQYRRELAEAEGAARAADHQLTAAEEQWADLQKTRNQLVGLQRQLDDLIRRIASLEEDLAQGTREAEALRTQADTSAIQGALAEVRRSLERLTPLQGKRDRLADARQALLREAANLRGINEALGPQTEPLKARAAVLEAATEPLCPTCGQPLSEGHRAELLEELHREIQERRQAYRANLNRIRKLEQEASSAGKQLEGLDHNLRDRPALEKRAGELEGALDRASDAAHQLERLNQRMARWSKELESDRARRSQLEEEIEACEQRLRSAPLTRDDLERLRLTKRLADERVGGARQKLAALDAFEEQRRQKLKAREALAQDLGIFEDLREAFGKRGVPAMIIETAVPELERAANDLLSRMTDGRLNIRIETQRETKTGELREALDIIISDELGSRAYEMYSGGEAFRIDFAIRIALSRLLARRAGAHLRSLFIDEGFGTQDAQGREHLVSAIHSIQHDFDRILVITHIEELKNAFPARIEVRKTPEGSLFSLA